MANKKISGMDPADLPLDGTEKVPIVQGGQNKECSTQDIADLSPGGGGGGTITSVNGDMGPVVVLVASEIGSTPAGTIAATNVQAAITELDTEKVNKAGDTMLGNLGFGGTLKNTGLAAGSSAGDSLRYEQVYTDWTTLTDGATTTWDTLGLQSPIAKWTMGATSRTIAMTNLKSGASGLLVVKTGVSGAITVTFPAGSVTDAGTLTTYTFPAGINLFYDLSWYYDGATTTIKWLIGVSNIDTDVTLSANSDLLVASQKATKTYVDTRPAPPSLAIFNYNNFI